MALAALVVPGVLLPRCLGHSEEEVLASQDFGRMTPGKALLPPWRDQEDSLGLDRDTQVAPHGQVVDPEAMVLKVSV